jgi:hypothetical protein
MTSINDYSYSQIESYEESDCETVYSNYEEETEYIEEEEPYNEYDNDECYYEHPTNDYVSVKDNLNETETFIKVDASIPKVNPWGLKVDKSKKEEPSKTFQEIVKEEGEKKRIDDIKKMHLEKENRKRKERFSHSRQRFNFRSNQNSEKKSSLLLNLKTKN